MAKTIQRRKPAKIQEMYFRPTPEQLEKLRTVKASLETSVGGRVSWQQTLSFIVTRFEDR
ncbi:MAG: hypothetical protein V1755_05675 [Chloroflexota bacterium]